MNLIEIMKRLYDSEINCGVQSLWDGGWEAWLGGGMNPRVTEDFGLDLGEIAEWLDKAACEHYPESDYAKQVSSTDSPEPKA